MPCLSVEVARLGKLLKPPRRTAGTWPAATPAANPFSTPNLLPRSVVLVTSTSAPLFLANCNRAAVSQVHCRLLNRYNKKNNKIKKLHAPSLEDDLPHNMAEGDSQRPFRFFFGGNLIQIKDKSFVARGEKRD